MEKEEERFSVECDTMRNIGGGYVCNKKTLRRDIRVSMRCFQREIYTTILYFSSFFVILLQHPRSLFYHRSVCEYFST